MTMIRTTMSEAFARVGIETPRDRVDRIVRTAVERHGGNRGAGIPAIVRELLDSDTETVWEFFAADREYRLQAEYDKMLRAIRDERGLDAPTPRAGRPSTAAKAAYDPAPARAAAGGGQGDSAHTGQHTGAASGTHAEPGQAERAASGTHAPHVPRSVLDIAEHSLLRSVWIDGRPLGECTAGRARSWAFAQGRVSRFVFLVAHGLQDEQIIGMCKTEDDAKAAYDLAHRRDD